MTERADLHERWHKIDAEFTKACHDVNVSHDVWAEACDRLKRLTRERAKAFQNLVAGADDEQQARPEPYSRECQARDIPGASCQKPNCDC